MSETSMRTRPAGAGPHGSPGSTPPIQKLGFTERARALLSTQMAGPLLALLVAIVMFSITTDTFLTAPNMSLMLQQSVVIGTLAIGQTLIILTAGIDLANGAIMVLGTVNDEYTFREW